MIQRHIKYAETHTYIFLPKSFCASLKTVPDNTIDVRQSVSFEICLFLLFLEEEGVVFCLIVSSERPSIAGIRQSSLKTLFWILKN